MGTGASLILTEELPLCVGSASGRGDLPARSRSRRLRDGSGDRSKLGKTKAVVVEVAQAHAGAGPRCVSASDYHPHLSWAVGPVIVVVTMGSWCGADVALRWVRVRRATGPNSQ